MRKYTVIPEYEGVSNGRAKWGRMSLPGEESRRTGQTMHLYRCPSIGFATIFFTIKDREYLYRITPCPARIGLARMARCRLKAALEGAPK